MEAGMNSGENRGKEFIEIRRNKDNTLLFRALHVGSSEIEIKCRRCGEKRHVKFPLKSNNEKLESVNKEAPLALSSRLIRART
jgi:hypothetical protein